MTGAIDIYLCGYVKVLVTNCAVRLCVYVFACVCVRVCVCVCVCDVKSEYQQRNTLCVRPQ